MNKQKQNIVINSKKYGDWKQMQEVQLVEISDIILSQKTHKKSFNLIKNSRKIEKLSKNIHKHSILNKPIIVKINDNGGYSLVSGIKGLVLASKLDHKYIPCIITECQNWTKFAFMINHMPIDCERVVNFGDIKIPQSFRDCPPKPYKISNALNYYRENGVLDKSITIDENGVLKNGYARYVASKIMKFNVIPVKLKSR